ncbi:Aste57867_25061 [Aphanomyces stellatus]|uniref:Aste57867_25061 protein n=1 Tax=Aphanomyces stellatus TaxID=120398 RepID=A0A485LS62_9STRA|nr:hypothetical protein As57867_024983 [Aphanomyces stellatus]VFU01692.1 Aste57867_25061 [Aphanomyces stellatus]
MGSGASTSISQDESLFHVLQAEYAAGVEGHVTDEELFASIKMKLMATTDSSLSTVNVDVKDGPTFHDHPPHHHDDDHHPDEHHDKVPIELTTPRSTRNLRLLALASDDVPTTERVERPHTPPGVKRTVQSFDALPGVQEASTTTPTSVPSLDAKKKLHQARSAYVHDPTKYRRASIVQEKVVDYTVEFSTDVLVDPVTLKMMIEFCIDIPHAVDRLTFWSEVQHLRSLPSAQYTDKMLRKIYEKFLSPAAPTPICVPTEMINGIQAEFESSNGIQSAGVYSEAQALCLKDLEKDIFPRFQKHKLFANMRELCDAKLAEAEGNGVLSTPRDDKYSFHAVLADDTKLRFLKSYCVENLTLENLLFHMEVEEAKRLPNQTYVHSCTRKVYDTYLKPNAKKHIALPVEHHDVLTTKYEANELDSAAFTDVQYLVLDYIRNDLWPDFSVYTPYVDHIHEGSLTPRHWDDYVPTVSETDVTAVIHKLEAMEPSEIIDRAMKLPMDQLANISLAHKIHRDTLMLFLHDKIAHRIFKRFLASRLREHYVTFIDEVDEFINLPGIEFMQHTAKKLFKKYLDENAKLQVDMSNKMRQEIQARLNTPSIDMFKPAIVKVKTGLLQDSMVRYLKSPIHSEMKSEKEHVDLMKELMGLVDGGKVDLPHLDSVLTNPKYLANFRKYLKTQHAAENLIFLEEVEEFRRLPSYQIVIRSAKKILDKYINTNTARSPIPIATHLHDDMVQNIDKAGKMFFSDAIQDVVGMLRTQEVTDFLDSPMFMQLVGSWVVLDETYAIRQLIGEMELAFFKHVVPLSRSVRRPRAGSCG